MKRGGGGGKELTESAKNAIGENNTGGWRGPGCVGTPHRPYNSQPPARGRRELESRREIGAPCRLLPKAARLGLRSPPGSADSVPANALAGASSPALLSREVGRGPLQQLEVPPTPRGSGRKGRSAPSEQAADFCGCWAPAQKVLGIRDLVLSSLE